MATEACYAPMRQAQAHSTKQRASVDKAYQSAVQLIRPFICIQVIMIMSALPSITSDQTLLAGSSCAESHLGHRCNSFAFALAPISCQEMNDNHTPSDYAHHRQRSPFCH